ncbi:MAG: aminotransferase class I/II-fold pyridoxal phosphate-dependent enzyme, partial [Planctomycetes bacterium]|nr:aminotransferase class I/II-fold pyridoxal phosphate-dependent enzyme [Planctomycetota bacterium]
GGVVVGSAALKHFLVNRSRPLIYTTAPPSSVFGRLPERLSRVEAAEGLRSHLAALYGRLAVGFACAANPAGGSIVPLLVGGTEETLARSAVLDRKGFFAPAILPPTVAPGSGRIRISLTAAHTPEDIDALLAAASVGGPCP